MFYQGKAESSKYFNYNWLQISSFSFLKESQETEKVKVEILNQFNEVSENKIRKKNARLNQVIILQSFSPV